jgi:hypothetical protein
VKSHRADVRKSQDFRRIATRYDKLARHYLAGITIAAAIVWWT